MPELNKKKNRKQTKKQASYHARCPKSVEEGNDDCGDDLKGLGCSAYYTDVPLDSDTESDGEEGTLITLFARQLAESYSDVFTIAPSVLWTTQQGRYVGTVWRKWRHLSASIQPRSVLNGKPRQTRIC
eukprot:6313897-Pyramimonas_sp.AAC.1